MKRLDDEKGNTSVNEDMNRCEEGRDTFAASILQEINALVQFRRDVEWRTR